LMRRIIPLLIIIIGGAALLAPVIMLMELERMPGDYDLVLQGRHYLIPVTYSLCASVALALLYSIVKR
ncbi:MAG: DUF2905 family protein, partial [Alphaproteobacteria bacterium]|nr:DUF2905 family protein [Alphaproteobacteria bacterium]